MCLLRRGNLGIFLSCNRLISLNLTKPSDGIREVARLETAMEDSYTGPTFAAGRIFVRDHRQVAAVKVTADGPAIP